MSSKFATEGVEPRETNEASLAIGFNSLPARTVIAIGLWGRRAGYHTGDGFVLLSMLLAALAALVVEKRKLPRDGLVFLPGAVVSLWVGTALYGDWTIERYLLRPGIFLVVGSGVLVCVLSASAVLKRSGAIEV